MVLPNKRLKLTGGDRFKGSGVLCPWRGTDFVQRPCAGGRVASGRGASSERAASMLDGVATTELHYSMAAPRFEGDHRKDAENQRQHKIPFEEGGTAYSVVPAR